MSTAIVATVLVILTINVLATVTAWRSDMFSVPQKCMQSVLIWLLPLVGASLVYLFSREPQAERLTTDLADRGGAGDTFGGDIGGHGGGDGH